MRRNASFGAVIGVWLVAGSALAQLDPGTGAPLDQPQATLRYRDGEAWVQVERVGPRQGGLQPVLCRREGMRFHAQVSRRAIVRLESALGVAPDAWLAAHALRSAGVLSARANLYWVEGGADEDGLDVAARLTGVAGILSATPDLFLEHRSAQFAIPPDDPEYGGQWYLQKLEIEAAWRLSSGDPAIKVAVLDTGCDLQHPDLAAAFAAGADGTGTDEEASFTPDAKGNEHGTACAGIVGAVGNNAIGMAGVCPQCSLLCIRLFGRQHELVPVSSDIAAFDRVLASGAAVASNSWGFAEATPVPEPLRTMIARVIAQGRDGLGTVVVFAAGNENREIDASEITAIDGVINVGAINNFEEAAPFSNFGPSLDLTAPGATFTTDISGPDGQNAGDYTALFGGTSAACPVVAGVAGLMLSADHNASATRVGELLSQTARRARYASPDGDGHDALYGQGVVAPAAALRALLGLPEPAVVAGAGAPAQVAPAEAKQDGGCSLAGDARGSGNGLCALGWLLSGVALGLRRRRAW